MGRLAFGINANDGTLQAGLPVKLKDEESGVFIASINQDDGYSYTIIDNQDGAYYVDGVPMGLYSVYIGSEQARQDELAFQVYINEDALAHFRDAADAGVQVWHHKINDEGNTVKELFSASKILELLGGKADAQDLVDLSDAVNTALGNHTGAANPHAGSASATPGTGLAAEEGKKLGINFKSTDFAITADGKLAILMALANESLLSNSKSLVQNLEILQNHVLNISSSGGGSFYQVLWSNARVDAPPNQTSLPSYINPVSINTTDYVFHALVPFYKIPEMRQAVYSFKAEATNLGGPAIGFMKFKCGSIESEMEITDEMGFSQFAIYLDLTSLANYEAHMLEIWCKLGSGIELIVDREIVALKQIITSVAGETNISVQNPTT